MSGNYRFLDVSSDTSSRVTAIRVIPPAGALIHTTSGVNSLAWLKGDSAGAGKPASANFLIARDGTRYKICPEGRYPYHAGLSEFTYSNRLYRGDEVSQILIGIELECLDSQAPTQDQYASLAECLRNLAIAYSWKPDYPILGHYAVAKPAGRRSDPVNMDWHALTVQQSTLR